MTSDAIPELEAGDWVRAREGFPDLLLVVDIGIWDNRPCAFDGHGGAIVLDAIAEIRKADGRRWLRGEGGAAGLAGGSWSVDDHFDR
jgi:hypothetical protein